MVHRYGQTGTLTWNRASAANDRFQAALYIVIGGGPITHTDAHCGAALPDGASAPAGSVFLNGGDGCQRPRGRAERDQDLVQNNLVEDFEARGTKTVAEAPSLAAISFDHFREATPAERTE